MQTLSYILFESAIAVGVLGFLVNFALLVYWRRTGRPRPLLIGLVVTAAALAVEAGVVTPHERAASTLDAIERDLLRNRVDALDRALHPDFRTGGLDRNGFLKLIQTRYLPRVDLQWLRRTKLETSAVRNERFTADVAYLVDLAVRDFHGTIKARTRLTFARSPDGWQVIGIDPPEGDGFRIREWESYSP